MKAVLQLMSLNFADAGKRVVLGLCLFGTGVCFVLQQSVLADNPGARRSLFLAQMLLLVPLIVPWLLLNPRSVMGSSWALMPWARVKFVWSLALTTMIGAAGCAVLYAGGVTRASGGISDLLGASLAAFPSTFTLLSMCTLSPLASPAPMPQKIVVFVLSTVGFPFATLFSVRHGMPQISDESWRLAVWLAFGGSVLAWGLGGWWFATRTGARHDPRSSWRPADFIERITASYLLRQGAAATLLKSHWTVAFRAPTLALFILSCLVPLLMQPRGTDGFVAAMALFSVMTAIRALVLGQSTARHSRQLWMVRGDRDALLRECEGVLFGNVVWIGWISGMVLLVASVLLRGPPSALQLFIGFGIATFLPLLFACIGLLQMALPARTQWWAGGGGIALSALLLFSPAMYAITNAEHDATGSIAILAAVALVLFLVCRKLARRQWRRIDWTFLPVKLERFLQSR